MPLQPGFTSPVAQSANAPRPQASRPGARWPAAWTLVALLEALNQPAFVFDERGDLLGATAGAAPCTRGSDLARARLVEAAARRLALASTHGCGTTAGLSDHLAPPRGPIAHAARLGVRLRRIAIGGRRAFGRATADLDDPASRIVVVLVDHDPTGGDADDRLRVEWGLTRREIAVAHHIADGLTTPQIAAILGISVHTARHHTERVFHKLGVRTRAAVAACLMRLTAQTTSPARAD